MRQKIGIAGCVIGAACGFLLEFVEQLVEILAVEDHARALAHGHKLGAPYVVKCAPLNANIFHGFLVIESSFGRHDRLLVSMCAVEFDNHLSGICVG